MPASVAIEQAVLLVGGLGTRLRPLTHQLPKALMPVANLPLIAYEIIPLARAGVKQIILAMGYRAELLQPHLGDGSQWGVELVYVEEAEPLGTAGALRNAHEHIAGPFFACNGDMIYDVDLAAFAADHVRREALITFCLRRTDDIAHFGLIQWDDAGRVTAFKEKVPFDETGRNTVNSGFYLMAPEVLDAIPPGRPFSNERDLFPALLREGKPLVAHLPARDGYWADVGRLDTYMQANAAVVGGKLSWSEPAVRSDLPASAELAGPADIAQGVIIGEGVVIGAGTAVGAGATIGDGAVVAQSIIWPGSRIGRGARVHGSVVAGASVPEGAGVVNEVIVD
ncbi:MAG: NDP-sugar synthase [Armatimonadetes bacterium]|nr:NDP-sugar synthase [Armatimonadota bacterium]